MVLGSIPVPVISESHDYQEGVYVTTGNAAFCLTLYLTGVHFRGELHLTGDVMSEKSSMPEVYMPDVNSFY